MSKDWCIQEIDKFSSVSVLKQHQMESVSIEHLVTYHFSNLEVEISLEENLDADEFRRILSATSYCGPYNMRNVVEVKTTRFMDNRSWNFSKFTASSRT